MAFMWPRHEKNVCARSTQASRQCQSPHHMTGADHARRIDAKYDVHGVADLSVQALEAAVTYRPFQQCVDVASCLALLDQPEHRIQGGEILLQHLGRVLDTDVD